MSKAHYRIVKAADGWRVETDGQSGELSYVTKEAAFQAIVPAADAAMSDGLEIQIDIPGGKGRWPQNPQAGG
jgi:hypothetical protein